jgi:hypothetical protein
MCELANHRENVAARSGGVESIREWSLRARIAKRVTVSLMVSLMDIAVASGNGGTGTDEILNADNIAMFQMGTHPALTASPIAYPLVNAAELAIQEIRRRSR